MEAPLDPRSCDIVQTARLMPLDLGMDRSLVNRIRTSFALVASKLQILMQGTDYFSHSCFRVTSNHDICGER